MAAVEITSPTGNTVIAEELQRLHGEHGRLTAQAVVEAATPESAPLHSYFTWDDSEAARAYRLQQASGLIRSVRIQVVKRDATGAESFSVRAYVAARDVGDGSEAPGTYYRAEDMTEEQKNLQLRAMTRELNALRRRYGHLTEFWDLVSSLSNGNGAAQAG
jgi:hypothetical protein